MLVRSREYRMKGVALSTFAAPTGSGGDSNRTTTYVCSHAYMHMYIHIPTGSGGDNNLVRALQQILPQALVGALASGQNVLLLVRFRVIVRAGLGLEPSPPATASC